MNSVIAGAAANEWRAGCSGEHWEEDDRGVDRGRSG